MYRLSFPQILRPTSISRKALVSYSFRFLFSLLTMEVLLQFIYVVALKDVKVALRDLGPGELLTVGFWNLIIVWLKVCTSLPLSVCEMVR